MQTKITDKLLNAITIGLALFLALFALMPIVGGAGACGTDPLLKCFAGWIGSAGSVTSGVGVFVLIYDLRQRNAAATAQGQEKKRTVSSARTAAAAAVLAVRRDVGRRAERILAAQGADAISLSHEERDYDPVEAHELNLRQLRAIAERDVGVDAEAVSSLEQGMRQLHRASQSITWDSSKEPRMVDELHHSSRTIIDSIDRLEASLRDEATTPTRSR